MNIAKFLRTRFFAEDLRWMLLLMVESGSVLGLASLNTRSEQTTNPIILCKANNFRHNLGKVF